MIHAFILHDLYREWLERIIEDQYTATVIYNISIVIITLALAYLAFKLGKWIIYEVAKIIGKKQENSTLNVLKKNKFFSYISYYLPLIVLRYSLTIILPNTPKLISLVENIVTIAAIVLFVMVINSVLNTFVQLNQYKAENRSKPIKGLVQFLQVIIWFFASIVCLSVFFSKSPAAVIGGLGAASAVLMLIFKDSITGLVAGVQLSTNKYIEIGDWISLPKYDTDGTVIDITLTSIKVQNWDKTISTVPSYNLMVTDSVKNYKGMTKAGGRRIARKVPLDMLSITFCTPETIERFRKTDYVKDALSKVLSAEANASSGELSGVIPNIKEDGLTNLGLFRAYMYDYLRHHDRVRTDMDLLVRQTQPDNYGIPLEIYCFANTTKWAEYEDVQSEIIEHVFAVLPYFELRVFQSPMSLTTVVEEVKKV